MAQTLSIHATQPILPQSPSTAEAPLLQDYCHTIFKGFLKDCNIPYHTRELDENVFKAACDSALKLGCCMSGSLSVVPHLCMGAMMGSVVFGHREFDIQVFIALYTGYLLYMNDMCARDASLVSDFIDTFILNQPQGHPVLDGFAALLLEMPDKFSKPISNVMVTSAMNSITALLLEVEVPHISLTPAASDFANFMRFMSGGAEAFFFFIFPRELSFKGYIHTLPDIRTYLNFGNDVLSFYKEEALGECANYMSILATASRTSKHIVLKNLADETAAAYNKSDGVVGIQPQGVGGISKVRPRLRSISRIPASLQNVGTGLGIIRSTLPFGRR